MSLHAERPVLFGHSRSLVGVMCSPTEELRRREAPVVVFLNAGIIHRVGPNRLYVDLARSLAAHGVQSLRFDLGGIGDSTTGREQATVLERVNRDIADAVDLAIAENGSVGVVLIGLCSGADNAFQTAVRDPRVVGAVLLDPNVHRTRGFYAHRYLRAILDPRTWKLMVAGSHPLWARMRRKFLGRQPDDAQSAPRPFLAPTTLPPRDVMRRDLGRLLERNCRLLYTFTGGLPGRYNYEKQFAHTFPDVAMGDCIKVNYFPLSDHSFSDASWHNKLIAVVDEWVSREPFGSGRNAGSVATHERERGQASAVDVWMSDPPHTHGVRQQTNS